MTDIASDANHGDAFVGVRLHAATHEKLDALFSESLELHQLMRLERQKANEAMKEGFFQMSSARHALPSLNLDSTAYRGRQHMWPQIGVRCQNLKDSENEAEEGNAVDSKDGVRSAGKESRNDEEKELEPPIHFKLVEVKSKPPPDDESEENDEDDEEAEEADNQSSEKEGATLRRRGVGGKKTEAEPQKDTTASSQISADSPDTAASTSTSSSLSSVDLRSSPLQWFGVLIPPELSNASQSFRQALTHLTSLATLQQRMSVVERRFLFLSSLQQSVQVDPEAEKQLSEVMKQVRIEDEDEERRRKAREEKQKNKSDTEQSVAESPAQ